jgi:hypothetical protein
VPQRIQGVHRVGPQQQSCADWGVGRRALKHYRLVASQSHSARSAQATYPGADDHDPLHALQHTFEATAAETHGASNPAALGIMLGHA